MQFEYTAPQTGFEVMIGGHYCINAFGKIEVGDDDKFRRFLESSNPPPRCSLYIDSAGGDVDAAIEIGRLVRGAWFSTHVGACHLDFGRATQEYMVPRVWRSGQCVSAATLIYLGGRLRYFNEDSKFGVHQFKFPMATGAEVPRYFLAKAQTLSARLSTYVSDMGISTEFLNLSSNVPDDEILFISMSKLEALGVVTGGQTTPKWSIEANNGIIYVKGERDSLYGHHKVMLCFNRDIGFAFWAVIETQGRAKELLGFPVVEIVIDGEDRKIDISSRLERGEFGSYVNIFARINEDEAHQLAYSDSFGVQIRGSTMADMFLGVSAMDTKDGKGKLQTFFENHKSRGANGAS